MHARVCMWACHQQTPICASNTAGVRRTACLSTAPPAWRASVCHLVGHSLTSLSFSLSNLTAGFFWIPRFLCRVSSVTPFKLSYSLRDTATTTWGASPNHSPPDETGLWVVHTVAAVRPESNSGQRSGGKRSPPVSQHMSFATCAQSVLSLWRNRG